MIIEQKCGYYLLVPVANWGTVSSFAIQGSQVELGSTTTLLPHLIWIFFCKGLKPIL